MLFVSPIVPLLISILASALHRGRIGLDKAPVLSSHHRGCLCDCDRIAPLRVNICKMGTLREAIHCLYVTRLLRLGARHLSEGDLRYRC